MSASARPRPIRPLDPIEHATYVDDLVVVRPRRRLDAVGASPPTDAPTARTPHFDVWARDGHVVLHHRVPDDRVDNDLAEVLRHELFGPGWVSGNDVFERLMTGIVRTTGDWADPAATWQAFYDHTLARLDDHGPTMRSPMDGGGHGTIADVAPVYVRAAAHVVGERVLDAGCCFGFLSLRLARAGHAVVASDVSPGTMALLDVVAPRLGVQLTTCTADAASLPLDDRAVDTVLLVHLLEHLDADQGRRVVAEAMRLADRRVVVAVPFEDRPEPTWGHVRCLDLATLDAIGRATGWTHRVDHHHGGWLVLDRPGTSGPGRPGQTRPSRVAL